MLQRTGLFIRRSNCLEAELGPEERPLTPPPNLRCTWKWALVVNGEVHGTHFQHITSGEAWQGQRQTKRRHQKEPDSFVIQILVGGKVHHAGPLRGSIRVSQGAEERENCGQCLYHGFHAKELVRQGKQFRIS